MAQNLPLQDEEVDYMKNLHKVEQVTRVVVGAIIAAVTSFTGEPAFYIPAAILIASGIIGFCPIYRIFKFDTL